MSLEAHCELLRSLHVPGSPLVLPNAWDVASAKAVVDAGFPVVATTSGGVAAALGFEDHEGAPADEMFAAAARIADAVDVPVTVDAEAGYGLEPAELVEALQQAGAAGCNLEDTNHSSGALRDPHEHAAWLREVRDAAGYPLVVNARIDIFLGDRETPQSQLVSAGLERARAAEGRVMLAGGLAADNVREAIEAVQPWAVDASSRLEVEPGVKDHDAVRAFVEAAR